MVVTDEEFRDIGYTPEARNYPRDRYGLIVTAIWNGFTVEELTPAMHYYPNAHMKQVWERVIQAIISEYISNDDWITWDNPDGPGAA